MTGHLRIKSPLSQLGILLAVFSPQLLLLIIGLLIGPGKVATPTADKINMLKWLQAGTSLAFFLLPAFLFAVFTFTGKYFYFLGLKKAEKPNMYILSALCILVAFPFVFWLGELNQQFPLPSWMTNMEKESVKLMEAFLKADNVIGVIINVILIALLPALCEELFFRGALQRILIHLTKNPWAGIIITGFLFSALHLQFQGFLPRMFLGIVLGAMYWYSGSLWTSIIAHFVNNAVQVIAVSYAPKYVAENPTIPIYAALISGLFVFGILWLFKRFSTVTYSKVYRIDDLTPTNQFLA